MQMGEGAKKSNVAIQYCMEYARFILQTVEIDAVTQVRASDDYHPGQTGYVEGVARLREQERRKREMRERQGQRRVS